MVVDCPIVIVSIGNNLFQSRPDQDWQILGQATLLLSWQLVLFSQPLLYCGWSQCTLCLLTMTADISWYQLQAGNNCKICLKTCCLLLNTVSLFSSPIEYCLFCLFSTLCSWWLCPWPLESCFTFVFFPSLNNITTKFVLRRVTSPQLIFQPAHFLSSVFNPLEVCMYSLPPPPPAAEKRKQRHHHSKITKGTKKNQDILAINFSRLMEVISVDIFCMKCPKAKQSKIKSIDLRGRPCSRVSAEGSAQLFGVC